MPGFNPENINIHDLTVEEPEKELGEFFDVERDITPEDREVMHKWLNDLRTSERWSAGDHKINWRNFARLASQMKIIGEDPMLTKEDLTNIENELNYCRAHDDGEAIRDLIKELIILGHRPDIKESDVEKIKAGTEELRTSTYAHFANQVEGLLFLGEKVPMTEKDWNYLEQGVKISKMEFAKKYTSGFHGRSAAHYFAQDILLGRDPQITKEELVAMKKDLERCRIDPAEQDEIGYGLASLAASLAIITAEKAEINADGLKIIKPKKTKPLESKNSDLPEQRKF